MVGYYHYTCEKCGKERQATYAGKKVCLACNTKGLREKKPKGFFGKAFEILKIKKEYTKI